MWHAILEKVLYLQNVKSVYYDTEKISFLGLKILDLLPKNIKDSENTKIFKSVAKLWKTENCPCPLRKIYLTKVVCNHQFLVVTWFIVVLLYLNYPVIMIL